MPPIPPSIENAFVVMSPDNHATIEPFDATLYTRIAQQYAGFKDHELISCHEFAEDWSTWEKHPHGDEVVILLSGKATFVLQQTAGEQCIDLENEGSYVIVPKNIWHTVKTKVKTKLLFITRGEGTEHKSV